MVVKLTQNAYDGAQLIELITRLYRYLPLSIFLHALSMFWSHFNSRYSTACDIFNSMVYGLIYSVLILT
jgi:hypothetical protein